MSALWTAAEAAAATGGQARGDWAVTGVSIDTRELAPGDLFVALTAARDGHDFVAQALAAGAGAALVSRIPEGVAEDAPLLLVPDVQTALEALGRAGRARTEARVIAITGSVGKTSAKEMMRAALASQGRAHAAERSFNNHWGVPLTLARMPAGTEVAVIEIGMNHPGEIAPLARMARPHAALITTIAAAHLEALGSLEAIAVEKASIFEGLEPDGLAVIPGDLPQTPILRAAAEDAGARIESFGTGAGNTHRLSDVQAVGTAAVARAQLSGAEMALKIATPGTHFLETALGVLACVAGVGADPARALMALGAWAPPSGRGTRERLQLDPVIEAMSIELIDDAFNANPTSMGAALDMLAQAAPAHDIGRIAKGRRIAILGDMLELGPDEAAMHAALAAHPAMAQITLVHCVGPRMQALHAALPEDKRGRWVETAQALVPHAHALVDAGDVVLVKGSKGSRVSLVVDALRKLGHPASRYES
ncbi:UDP-N-acetylmuramoyl-tripeptide--D-alanyl-D-alanine ligase [Dinoroseobacter shibae DFL 12 = DSM 16493]|jgi:UDP-N-acetylmuramoyl-tripeptide--D-alanyl-D-alanine ligase|uniref:UDP-N-acetylmuramoyl-tripeptide--D-alanyl-D-alanine ligase n=1 Tax=Dinoroseobacter shibae (strain DSM 16493 / NCIMB 14021 / DFL 12) TaxID=398580 RepID=A8LSB1_DINSH|nr:UDP-N-acetylmuramoyl-tripeptide--D-alanyl-D-alanine ligase [Dinoroseobacter shibae]ABV94204.1 UDP-N-acetylmuramoyl-tripeptide--D-alanyl-D-alanine ligase [Dinoroseobacter shibae DFL 12 = DSM 16493]URF45646.1 UDP-N-acetylmuramoyl-tripeptide--D-alanyl-D-alanine ligase [Dinoroseobacter shibae]URF49951.1 UDP-N-acetylmuramoyl-tripeptide--D-alanyl-D-alanine ligase [Dinoroseobacter shibae]